MRQAFTKWLVAQAASDPRIILLTDDLGFGLFDDFRAKYPDRFLNCGIAEQNMVGVAAGLARLGRRPFVYAISPFLFLRALEQIKLDVALACLPVTFIGAGSSLDYGHAGPTHYSLEDIGILSLLPNFSIYSPASDEDTLTCVEESIAAGLPSYHRLSNVSQSDPLWSEKRVAPGLSYLKGTSETIVLSTGAASQRFRKIADPAGKFSQLHFAGVHPFDAAAVTPILKKYKRALIVEDQIRGSGLSRSIALLIVQTGLSLKVTDYSLNNVLPSKYGHGPMLREEFGVPDSLPATDIG